MIHTTSRQTYLDWLRILAIFGVLIYHSARPFITDDPWHINNETTSNLLMEFNFWLSRFRMHLLFFISGAISIYIIWKKSTFSFIGIRAKRLFIPVIVGMVFIVPPQIYFERLSQGFEGNFLDFYPSVFQLIPYPEGNTSWHHLWFIVYLGLYNILLAPFFIWSASSKGKAFAERLQFFAEGQRMYLLIIPSVIWFSFTVVQFPQTHDLIHDPAYFIYWLLFLIIGYLFMLQSKLMDSLERNRKISLSIAFLLMVGINSLRWNGFEWSDFVTDWQNNPWTPLYISIHPLNSWFWVFAIVGYGKRYLNKQHEIISYLNEAVYPFYILHQTIIIVIGYYVIKTSDAIGMKFIFITMTALIVSLLIYHLFIKPFNFMRFLFGLKPLDPVVKKTEIPNLKPTMA
jgi:glucans biosynthesis protein C